MKILQKLIKVFQFIIAMFMIFALGQWLITRVNKIFDFEITPFKLFIFSFIMYLILIGMNYLFKEKE